jgi:hypothetical protein
MSGDTKKEVLNIKNEMIKTERRWVVMSSLWNSINFLRLNISKRLKIKERPSPKHKKQIFAIAQNQAGILPGKCTICNSLNFIKRISLPAFFFKKIKGGMTVEASIVLPLFIFFFLNLSCAVEMIRLHVNLEAALYNTGTKMSVYGSALTGIYAGYMEDDEKDEENRGQNSLIQEIGDIAFTYTYVKNAVIKYTGKDYLDSSPLLKGVDGLVFAESDIFTGDDTFEITMTYAVGSWIQYVGIRPFCMANKYYGHIWNGYDLKTSSTDDAEYMTVYIAENATVYHINRKCTHLRLTIREVKASAISDERNAYGNRYGLCEKCGKGVAPYTFYVGKEGDKYHYKKDCPGLSRTVFSMSLKEAEEKYRACSRCSR